MLEVTDLNKCKEVAKILLRTDIVIPEKTMPFIISHPIINDMFIPDKELGLINILENKEAYNKTIQTYTELIDNATDYDNLIIFIRNPYKLFYIKATKRYLSIKDFSTNLIDSWIVDENANDNINVSPNELVKYFKEASKEYMMDKEDLEVYNNLDDVVIIYRGLNDMEKSEKAMSWSLSIDVARWFAQRFNNDGNIYQAKVNKKDILVYCNTRKEQEVIVDYKKVYDVEKVK